jgi:hypothetical protein
MRFPRKRGAASVMARVFIPDNSVTTGAGCAGLSNTSANLAICYVRERDSSGTEVTGANLLAISTVGTWLDPAAGKLRFGPVDAAKLPGLYEVQFPDAAAFGTADVSQHIVIAVYEKTTTALKIGPNMVMIPLSKMTVLDGESNSIQLGGQAVEATGAITFPAGTIPATTTAMLLAANQAVNATNAPSVAAMLAGGLFGTSNAPATFSAAVFPAGTVAAESSVQAAIDAIPAAVLAGGGAWESSAQAALIALGTMPHDVWSTINVDSQDFYPWGTVGAYLYFNSATAAQQATQAYAGITQMPTATQIASCTAATVSSSTIMRTTNAPATFAAAVFPTGTVASTTNITAGTVSLASSQHVIVDSGTVTTLSNLPAIPNDWLAAAGVNADAVTKIQAGLMTNTTAVALATSQPNYAPAKAGDSMSLAPAYDATKTAAAATAVQAALDAICAIPATITLQHGNGSYLAISLAGVAQQDTLNAVGSAVVAVSSQISGLVSPTAANAMAAQFATMVEADGALWRYTEAAMVNVNVSVGDISGLTDEQAAMLAAIMAKANLIGAGTVTLTPAVRLPGPTITIVIGDSYGQSHGRPAIVLIDDTDQWPSNYADGTIKFSVKKYARNVELSVTATPVTVDGHKAVSVAMTSEDTAALSFTLNHQYDLRVHWDDGNNMALIDPPGPCEVEMPVTPPELDEDSE